MYYQNTHNQPSLIGKVYLIIAAIGVVYYCICLNGLNIANNVTMKLQEQHTQHLLLLITVIEFCIGLYIKASRHPVVLFCQSFATVLLMAAHGMLIYAFISIDMVIVFTHSHALIVAFVFIGISALLHLVFLFEKYFKAPLPKYNPYIDEAIDFDDYE